LLNILICGQGLSGTLLAARLLELGMRVTLIDPASLTTSSRVAAGVIHPITGRRLTKSWRLDELLPFAINTYKKQEAFLKEKFYHDIRTLELFKDVAHRNDWLGRSADPEFSPYIGNECFPSEIPNGVVNEKGGIWITKGGWLDTNTFLDAWRKYFHQENILIESTIEEDEIHFTDKAAIWDGKEYDAVIDCRGIGSYFGKWFSDLPFNPAKGELVTIHCEELTTKDILHKTVKLIPTNVPHEFICGATFSWEEFSTTPTEEGRKELEQKIGKLIQLPYTIVKHVAGVRPATDDRRPFVQEHETIKRLFILNGFGAKGVLLAPYFANELSQLIERLYFKKDY